MYTEFFGLDNKPFEPDPDVRFIQLSKRPAEALASLVYAIEERQGWALVLGKPGTGKTTLALALLAELGDSVWPAVITNPNLEPADFFNVLSMELGFEKPISGKGEFLLALRGLITFCRKRNKSILIIIDDAQTMPDKMLLELLLLSRQDSGNPRVLNIFLLGTPELGYRLKNPSLRSLLQSIRLKTFVKPLNQTGVANYMRFRLEAAGGSLDIFEPEAIDKIAERTGGNQREINALCDLALLTAFSRSKKTVDAELLAGISSEGWEARADQADPEPEPESDVREISEFSPVAEAEEVHLGHEEPPSPTLEPEPPEEQAANAWDEPPFEEKPKHDLPRVSAAMISQPKWGSGGLRQVAAMALVIALLGGVYGLANYFGPPVLGIDTKRQPQIYIPPPPGGSNG